MKLLNSIRKLYQMQLMRISSSMSLVLSMQASLMLNPEAGALLEDENGKIRIN